MVFKRDNKKFSLFKYISNSFQQLLRKSPFSVSLFHNGCNDGGDCGSFWKSCGDFWTCASGSDACALKKNQSVSWTFRTFLGQLRTAIRVPFWQLFATKMSPILHLKRFKTRSMRVCDKLEFQSFTAVLLPSKICFCFLWAL